MDGDEKEFRGRLLSATEFRDPLLLERGRMNHA